jgi:hypothetical protein
MILVPIISRRLIKITVFYDMTPSILATCKHVSEVLVDSIFRAIKGNKLLGEMITLHKETMGRQQLQ